MRELLRIARRPAYLALALDARQALPRIENHPAPLVQLVLEQGQQRTFAGRLDTIRGKQRGTIEIEVLRIQILVMLHRIEKRGILDQIGSEVTRAQKAAR